MASFSDVIDQAVADGDMPGVVMLAKRSAGEIVFKQTCGKRSLSKEHGGQAMEPSTVFQLASSSKLITVIAALQAVEKGLIGLDDDVCPLLPALAKQEVLVGFRWYGKPVTKPRDAPITLRQLLTNTAGTGYDFLAIQPLWRWRWWFGQKIGGDPGAEQERSSIDERLGYPLLHEPGQGWTYGSGASWAGRVVEIVSGMSLEDWIKRYISAPLGLSSFTFFPERDPAIASRLAKMNRRDYWTAKVLDCPTETQAATQTGNQSANSEGNDICLGGEGLYSSLEDYLEVLHSLLADDGKLLSKEMTAEMFTPQVREGNAGGLGDLRKCLGLPCWISQGILKKDEFNWGIGGVLIDGDGHEYLKKGSLMWSGLFHLLWWMDRESGVCGIFGAQLVPAADKTVILMIKAFQKEVYRRLKRTGDDGEQENGAGLESQNDKLSAGKEEAALAARNGSDDAASSWTTQCDSRTTSPSSGVMSFLAWALKLWRRV